MNDTATIEDICARLSLGVISRELFVDECVRFIGMQIACSRVGLWIFVESPRGRLLRCLGMYDRTIGPMRDVEDESEERSGPFFFTLDRLGHVIASDAHTHPATGRFFAGDPRRSKVRSLMAAAFALNGKLCGALTCTNLVEPMLWTHQQFEILRHCGSRATLALATSSPRRLDSLWAPLS